MRIYIAIHRSTDQIHFFTKWPSVETHTTLAYLDHDRLYIDRPKPSWISRLVSFIFKRWTMQTFNGRRIVYSTPPTCTQDTVILLACATERVDPCFECNADRSICHGRSYKPIVDGVHYRFTINGEWKPYTPIQKPWWIMLYIPTLEVNREILDDLASLHDKIERQYIKDIQEAKREYKKRLAAWQREINRAYSRPSPLQ